MKPDKIIFQKIEESEQDKTPQKEVINCDTLEELEEEIKKVYLVKDPYLVRLLLALVVAHFLPTDPAWVVIIAASGGGKSEFINMLNEICWTPKGSNVEQKVHPLSTLTAKTFVSGFKNREKAPSLLTQISNGILSFKDLTSLLSEHRDDRAVVMAQLREIWDGRYNKRFGTGEEVSWKGKISIIAGATYAIHALKQAYTAMGERFIFYNIISPERKEAAEKTMDNQAEGKMAEHRNHLTKLFTSLAKKVLAVIPDKLPELEKELKKDIISLAELTTRARSDVERNWRSPMQEITEVHPPEEPTRFAGSLQGIIHALEVIEYFKTQKFELSKSGIDLIKKLALDSIPRMRRVVMQELSRYDVIQTAGLAVKIGLPTNSVRRYLEDLVALEIADREKGKGNEGDRWNIKPLYRELIMKFEGIVFKPGEELTAENAEPVENSAIIDAELAEQNSLLLNDGTFDN